MAQDSVIGRDTQYEHNLDRCPYVELLFASRGKKKGLPLFWGRPLPIGECLLAHGGDSLEDDAAHERDAHAEAGESERGVHAHLDAASIKHHGEDGEDRTDCEASDTRTIESDFGVGLVRVHVEVLSCWLLFFRQHLY